jgi:hypothetical protein
MMAGRDASNRHATPIEILQHDPAAYDMVVVGTPVWVQSVSCGIRTYLQHAGPTFQGVALFTTSGWGRRPDEAVQETTELCQREPVAVLSLSSRAVKRNRHSDRLKRFVAEVRRATNVSQANSSS